MDVVTELINNTTWPYYYTKQKSMPGEAGFQETFSHVLPPREEGERHMSTKNYVHAHQEQRFV